VRRSQILEVAALTGAIVLVWLGARLNNQPGSWAEALSAKIGIGTNSDDRPRSRRLTPER